MLTDKALVEEILDKKKYIKKKGSDIYVVLEELFDGALEREALEHSLRIEYPVAKALKKGNTKKYTKEIKRLSKNLKKAWEFGKKNFTIPFDKDFLIKLAYQIDPEAFRTNGGLIKDYRKFNVRVRGSCIKPPYPEKLRLSMKRFFDGLDQLYGECKNRTAYVPERYFDIGSWMHLHLARIHPFEDTNGRTSRMANNLYLRSSNSFPPIIIYEGERQDYENHIEKALIGFRERDGRKNLAAKRDELSGGEREFYDYLAGKLNTSLDKVIEKKGA
ncbi:MAG: Fic family protein [Candidatus Pacearchaeota archaeon]|nr:MAG: Fic family protein [Candidatus Pacearchaeota archaeon]